MSEPRRRTADVARAGAFTAVFLCSLVGALHLLRSLQPRPELPSEAERHLARGGGFEQNGYLDGASSEYRKALELARSTEEPLLVARAANRLAVLHQRSGDAGKARELAEEALEAAGLARDDGERAAAHFNLGFAEYSVGRARAALRSFELAAELASTRADPKAESTARLHAGWAALMLDRRHDALRFLERARHLSKDLRDTEGEAAATRALGQVYSRLGDYQEALDRFDESRRLLEPTGDAAAEAALLNAIGQVYLDLGMPDTALMSFQEALALGRRLRYRRREAASLSEIGRCYLALGELDLASRSFGDALRIYRELGNPRLEADVLVELGRLAELGGDHEAAFAHFDRAVALKRRVGDLRYLAYVLNEAARLETDLGRYEDAKPRLREALELSRAVHDPWGESLALYQMARIARGGGRLDEALSRIERSLEILEQVRTKVASHALRTSFLSSVHERYAFLVDLLVRLDRRRPGRGYGGRALQASERARARTLLDVLGESAAGLRTGLEPSLLAEERALRERLNDAAREQLLLPADAFESASELEREIDALASEYDRLLARIRSSSPRYRALTTPETPSLDEIRFELLEGDTRLLAYALGEERSFVWSLSRDAHSLVELPPRGQIEMLARRVHQALSSSRPSSSLDRDLEALRDLLLAPLKEAGTSSRLLVVADGALSYLPFGALPLRSGEPLVTRTEVVRLPSISVLPLLRDQRAEERHAKLALVVADPVYGLGDPRTAGQPRSRSGAPPWGRLELARLRGSRREAETIKGLAPAGTVDVLSGLDASRERLAARDLTRYRIVHFATHGFVDDERPGLSGIVLSLVDGDGNPRDGFLRLHDVYRLELAADLVVLSACETAVGAEERGEGIVGLVRGFMYAGARSVIASTWKADDEATAELMRRFYERLFSGVPRTRALREAQVAMFSTSRWSAPYYWAGFELQGDWS